MQKQKSFPGRQFLVYNAEIFFVNSYNPRALVVKRTKLNSKKGVMWNTLVKKEEFARPDWNGYNSTKGVMLIKTIIDYQNNMDFYWHYGRSIGALKNIRMHIIIKQEGDKNEVE